MSDGLFTLFSERLAMVSGVTVRVGRTSDGIAAITEHLPPPATLVIARTATAAFSELSATLTRAGYTVNTEPTLTDATTADAGISVGAYGIADSGTVALVEPNLDDRAVSMLTPIHFILLREEEIVPTLADAAPLLRAIVTAPGGGNVTYVTGPSRTADIERTLTVGVQGPGQVIVLVTVG